MIESYLVDIPQSWRLSDPSTFWDVLHEVPVTDRLSECSSRGLDILIDAFASECGIPLPTGWKTSLGAQIIAPSGCQVCTILNRQSAQVLRTQIDRTLHRWPTLPLDLDGMYGTSQPLQEEFAAAVKFFRRQASWFRPVDDRLLVVVHSEYNAN